MEAGPGVKAEPLRHLDGNLRDDEVHVWYVDLKTWEKQADSLLDLLDSQERERTARFKFPGPRNQFLISRAILRRALGCYLRIDARQIRFRTRPNGKPELAANSAVHFADLRFNLSHTEGTTVFAIARHRRVGIDVERIRPDTNVMELAERFFSHPEVQWLQSQPSGELIPAFFTCWTGKEAYIKAHGQGLSLSLSSFGVVAVHTMAGFDLQLNVYEDPAETKRWSMWPLELGHSLRAALAVEGQGCKVRLGRWPSPEADAALC
jgi:4'-phosphopantetheinyl transferase